MQHKIDVIEWLVFINIIFLASPKADLPSFFHSLSGFAPVIDEERHNLNLSVYLPEKLVESVLLH